MANDNPLADLWIDHLGLAVHDVAPVVPALRNARFKVSDPVELQGADGPMGQVSAHCIFENFYLEISAPIPGHDNHLRPILETVGPGLAIILMQCADASARQAELASAGLDAGPVNDASRAVLLETGEQTARFRWFPVTGLVENAIVAEVEHRDPETVFASELAQHPNGARQIERISMGTGFAQLGKLAIGCPHGAPKVTLDKHIEARKCTIMTDTGNDLLELCLEVCG